MSDNPFNSVVGSHLLVTVFSKSNMLAYYIVAALLFFAAATADNSRHEEEVIQAYVTNKCSKNGGEHALDNLINSTRQAGKCLFKGFFKPRDNDYEYLCGDFRSTVYSCLVTLTESIEPCLDNVEKFLPDFMLTFYNSSFEEHCKDGAEKLEEHLQVLAKYKCNSLGSEARNYILENCFSKSTILKDLEDLDFVIPKNAFCGYLEHANECAIGYVKHQCHVEFAELIESHLQPTKDWCDSYVKKQSRIIAPPQRHR